MLLCAALVLLGANFYQFVQRALGDHAPRCHHEQLEFSGHLGDATFEVRGCFDDEQRDALTERMMARAAEAAAAAEVRIRVEERQLRALEREMRAHERQLRRAERSVRSGAQAPAAPLPPEL